MRHRRRASATLAALALAVLYLSPVTAATFPEKTETNGEIAADLNGVWLVVQHIDFASPSPAATPTPEGSPAAEPTPAASPAAEASPAAAAEPGERRVFNVLNLFRIVHLKKPEARRIRELEARMEQASLEKAKAIVAARPKKDIPVLTETGEVEGGPRVLVPEIPRRPDFDPAKLEGDAVEIFLLDVAFPKSIEESAEKANAAQKPYLPSDKDLALLRSTWQDLKPSGRDEYSRIEWKVVAEQFYDENLQTDTTVAGSKFAVTGVQTMIPKPGQPNQNIVVYGAREVGEKVIKGRHVRAMMAGAPFTVPIELKGHFEMYKVAALPEETPAKKEAQ
jgi:hypothetical protein